MIPGNIPCRVIRPYGFYQKDDIIFPPGGNIAILVARGLIEEVKNEASEIEETILPTVEQATMKPKRPRGRKLHKQES